MAKLLLVTADGLLAKAYSTRLGRMGHQVDWQSTGHDALARARREIPELILLDATLPGLHGLDVLKFLRDVPPLVKVPVILLIERTLSREIVQQCRMWGAGSCVEKDTCSLEELTRHVAQALQPVPVAPSV